MGIGRNAGVVAVAMALAGCVLISGASDLEVGPIGGAAADGGGVADDGDRRVDVIEPKDATGDVADVGDADTSSDASSDASTRIRDVTFEDGVLKSPTTGVDRTQGTLSIVTTMPLAGTTSVRVQQSVLGTSSLGIDLAVPEPELWLSMLFRFDSNLGKQAVFLRLTLASPSGTVSVGLSGGRRLELNQSTVLGLSDVLLDGVVYRLGLHVHGGANGTIDATLAQGAGPDTLFATTSATLGSTTKVDFGQLTLNDIEPVFDNVRLDRASLPPR